MAEYNEYKEIFEKIKNTDINGEKYISLLIDAVITILINRRNHKQDVYDNLKVESFAKYIKSILKDIYDDYISRSGNKNKACEDIEFIGLGFTFLTFRVGDNVIKIGKNEIGIKRPKLDSNLLIPIYFSESYQVSEKFYFNIEVAPFVDTSNISYDDVFKMYLNIRKLGYIWNDPKEENMGRVINISGCVINKKKYMPSHELKKGDLVVIDLQDMAYVGKVTDDIVLEEIATMSYNKDVYKFECKYIEEQKQNSTTNKI